MAKIKIEYIKHNLSKNGKTKLCSIKTLDKNGQEVWIGGFGNTTTESWQKGQTIDLDIFQEEYNGNLKWKFREPVERNVLNEIDALNAKIDLVLSKIDGMVNSATQAPKTYQNANSGQIKGITAPPSGTTVEEMPFGEEPINVDDLPW